MKHTISFEVFTLSSFRYKLKLSMTNSSFEFKMKSNISARVYFLEFSNVFIKVKITTISAASFILVHLDHYRQLAFDHEYTL